MSQWEINAKKIETLTKVAKLLGDQIQIQSKAINQLQNEIDWIKETLKTKKRGIDQVQGEHKKQTSENEPSIATPKKLESKSSTAPKKKASDKEELLQALHIIDDL